MLEPLAFGQFLARTGAAEVRRRILIPAEDHGEELAKVQDAISHLEDQYLAGKVYAGRDGAARYGVMLSSLEGKRDMLASLPSAPARVEFEGTGESVAQRWEALDEAGKRVLMAESGYRIRAARDRENGLRAWFRLDADLAKRAAGHAADVPRLMTGWALEVRQAGRRRDVPVGPTGCSSPGPEGEISSAAQPVAVSRHRTGVRCSITPAPAAVN